MRAMFKACDASQMRALDRAAAEKGGIPGIILMENAALACVAELKKTFSDLTGKSVAVFCGHGNNGGDGLAIARHLHNMGVNVNVFLTSPGEFNGDAAVNFDIVKNMDIPIDTITDSDGLEYMVRAFDIVIDAILGTGINGTVRSEVYDIIRIINENARYIFSVDVPSGINSDSGEICGICINADKTVTFGGYKIGMFMYPAADCTGEIVPDMISVPRYIVDGQNLQVNVTDSEFVRNIIGERGNNSHKGDYGRLLIIAGSQGMSGAAFMAAQSALRSGAGLITLACPASINTVLESKTTEVMTLPLGDSDGHFAENAFEELRESLDKAGAVLIGPGIGRSPQAAELVRAVLKHSRVPVVVDADAINAVAEDMSILAECACELIFTPHTMEFSRLTGLNVSYIEDNRLEVSREFSEEYGAVLLLKGHHTIVTDPSLTQYINNTGNPGLASGGSGDVLAGITASLAARGIQTAEAAAAAAYIHGMAGDIAAQSYSHEAMSALDVINCLPQTFCRILQLDK